MLILHDKRLPSEYKKALDVKLPSVIWVPLGGDDEPGVNDTYASIACHPDIYFFQLGPKTLIHSPGLSERTLAPLREAGIELIRGETAPGGHYPDTAVYNALRVGNILFHNLKHTDPVILERSRGAGLKPVDISQGYSRCAALVVDEKAIITADRGIASAARNEGIEVLLIGPGSVYLPGEDRGFIGGAGGIGPNGEIIVLGGIRSHPQYDQIMHFIAGHKKEYVDVKGLPLYDAGGLFVM